MGLCVSMEKLISQVSMDQSRTFVILTPGFPASEEDSTCLPFPQLFVKTLQRENPSLKIIVLSFQYPFHKKKYQWHGITVIPFNGRNRGKLFRLLVWHNVTNSFRKIQTENNVIGILNFWMGECAYIGHKVSRKTGIPAFTWLMGQDARKDNRYFSMVKPAAENLIALSDFLSDEIKKNYAVEPKHIITPGIDKHEFAEHERERNIDIIGVGSLIPLKQFDIFIKVVATIVKKHPHIKAVICGSGPERKHLWNLIEQHHLHGHIVLLEETPHAEVLALMQHSKILLHPSSYEGFATVYNEALYAGVHVVGFSKPMHHTFEHLHIVNTEEEMMNKVDDILSMEMLRNEPVLTYTIEETCNKVMALYAQ